jgi:hypothetical protein
MVDVNRNGGLYGNARVKLKVDRFHFRGAVSIPRFYSRSTDRFHSVHRVSVHGFRFPEAHSFPFKVTVSIQSAVSVRCRRCPLNVDGFHSVHSFYSRSTVSVQPRGLTQGRPFRSKSVILFNPSSYSRSTVSIHRSLVSIQGPLVSSKVDSYDRPFPSKVDRFNSRSTVSI